MMFFRSARPWALFGAFFFLAISPALLAAQGSQRPFEIRDNSFLIEEAFTQDRGEVQTKLLYLSRENGSARLRFDQEWPLGSDRHEFSYTIPFQADGSLQLQDIRLHYRYGARVDTTGELTFTPRLSVILPTAANEDEQGEGTLGWQLLLPVSRQFGDLYFHGNASIEHRPRLETATENVSLLTPSVGGSAVWRVSPQLNLLVETRADFQEQVAGPGQTSRQTVWRLSPGFRAGWDIGQNQLVIGAAAPFGLTQSVDNTALLGYISYELSFK